MNSAVLAATGASSGNAGQTIIGLILIAAGIIAYWIPSLIAWRRKAPHTGSIVVVNLFLGWTIVGWVVALAMAMRDPQAVPQPPAATR